MAEGRTADIKAYCKAIDEALEGLPRAKLQRRKDLSQKLWFTNRILAGKPLTAKQGAQVLNALTWAILKGTWAYRD